MNRFFSFLNWWPTVKGSALRADAMAGLVGALVVLPQGMAFALLAGLPPEYGLYTAMVPTIMAALFGSSLHAVIGPANSVSLMVFAVLSPLAVPGSPEYISLALTLSLLCGAMMLALGALRMGTLVNFMSDAVIVGFTGALAVLIAGSQLRNALGIDMPAVSGFMNLVMATFENLDQTKPWVVVAAASTIAAGVASRSLKLRLPAMLTATIAGSAIALALNAIIGAERTGITTLGTIPSAFPSLSHPDFSPETLRLLLGGAVAVTIVSLTQGISIARAIALKSGQRLNNNQEFIGYGLANIAGSFFSAYPSSASLNRCAINYESGARSPMSAIFAALLLIVTLLAVAPLLAYLPVAVIAGVLMLAAMGMINWPYLRRAAKTARNDLAVLAATFLATLTLNLEIAILAGVAASLVMYLNRTSHPSLRSLVPDPRRPGRNMAEVDKNLQECPQMKILRIEGSIYFGACSHVEDHFDQLRRHSSDQKHLLLMSKSINFVDMAGADLIGREAMRRNALGGGLYLYSPRKPVEDILQRGGYMRDIGKDHVFRGKSEAFNGVFMRLDRSICKQCRARIFLECQTIPGPGPDA